MQRKLTQPGLGAAAWDRDRHLGSSVPREDLAAPRLGPMNLPHCAIGCERGMSHAIDDPPAARGHGRLDARTHLHGRRLHAALAHHRLRARYRAGGGPGRGAGRRTPSSWRCGCRIISARSSPRALSMPPSCRPMRACAPRAGRRRPASSPIASSRCCWRARWCCSAIALVFTPAVIELLAPGFSDKPDRFALAVELTRITFPYLLLVTLVTLYGGILNAVERFAAAAAAPILLNLSMIGTLAFAAFFPTAGHAAAWGVLIAGVLEVLLVGGAALARRSSSLRCAGRPGTPTSSASSRRSRRRRSARPACRSRSSPTPSSRASSRPARSRRSITPTGSISCRSA